MYNIFDSCDTNLYNFVKKYGFLSQNEALNIIKQILQFFIQFNQIHQNLNPLKIFIKEGIVKLSGFGNLSDPQKKDEQIKFHLSVCPETINDEILRENSDVWSLGVIFYFMIFGDYPFNGNNLENLKKDIQQKILDNNLLDQKKDQLTILSFELLQGMLQYDFQKRLTWSGIKKIMNQSRFIQTFYIVNQFIANQISCCKEVLNLILTKNGKNQNHSIALKICQFSQINYKNLTFLLKNYISYIIIEFNQQSLQFLQKNLQIKILIFTDIYCQINLKYNFINQFQIYQKAYIYQYKSFFFDQFAKYLKLSKENISLYTTTELEAENDSLSLGDEYNQSFWVQFKHFINVIQFIKNTIDFIKQIPQNIDTRVQIFCLYKCIMIQLENLKVSLNKKQNFFNIEDFDVYLNSIEFFNYLQRYCTQLRVVQDRIQIYDKFYQLAYKDFQNCYFKSNINNQISQQFFQLDNKNLNFKDIKVVYRQPLFDLVQQIIVIIEKGSLNGVKYELDEKQQISLLKTSYRLLYCQLVNRILVYQQKNLFNFEKLDLYLDKIGFFYLFQDQISLLKEIKDLIKKYFGI